MIVFSHLDPFPHTPREVKNFDRMRSNVRVPSFRPDQNRAGDRQGGEHERAQLLRHAAQQLEGCRTCCNNTSWRFIEWPLGRPPRREAKSVPLATAFPAIYPDLRSRGRHVPLGLSLHVLKHLHSIARRAKPTLTVILLLFPLTCRADPESDVLAAVSALARTSYVWEKTVPQRFSGETTEPRLNLNAPIELRGRT